MSTFNQKVAHAFIQHLGSLSEALPSRQGAVLLQEFILAYGMLRSIPNFPMDALMGGMVAHSHDLISDQQLNDTLFHVQEALSDFSGVFVSTEIPTTRLM